MAITGLIGVRGANLKSDGTYENPFHIGDAIQANLSINMVDGSLYANNRRKEHKQKFDSGTLALGVDDLTDEVQRKILGKQTITFGTGTGAVTMNASSEDDTSPMMGVGFYQTVRRDDVDMCRVVVLAKVQFSEPQDNAQTADNNININGRDLNGTIMSNDDKNWKYDVTVENAEAAEAVLDLVLGPIPVSVSSSQASESSGTNNSESTEGTGSTEEPGGTEETQSDTQEG